MLISPSTVYGIFNTLQTEGIRDPHKFHGNTHLLNHVALGFAIAFVSLLIAAQQIDLFRFHALMQHRQNVRQGLIRNEADMRFEFCHQIFIPYVGGRAGLFMSRCEL